MEAKTQQKLIKYLKGKGCFVIKMQAGPGVPVGTPDVFFCKDGFYGFAEVKASKFSKYQTLQKQRIALLDEWSWCRVIHPENINAAISELDTML